MPPGTKVDRVRQGATLIAELRSTAGVSSTLADGIAGLIAEHQEVELAMEGDQTLEALLLRLAIVTEKLEPHVARLAANDQARANAAVAEAEAKKLRAETWSRIATPKNALAALLVVGAIVAGIVGLPVGDWVTAWLTSEAPAVTP